MKRNKKVQAMLLAGFLTITTITGTIVQTKYEINSNATNNVVQVKQTGTTKTALNMRKSASTKGAKITTIPKGKQVTILNKESNGWYKVQYGSKTGYVSGSYLTISTQSTNTNTNTNTTGKQTGTTKTALNMRKSASTKGAKVTTIPKGKQVTILNKESNGWYKVQYGSKTGYVSGSYLTLSNQTVNATPAPTPTPAPSVSKGISFTDFKNRLSGMGFGNDGFYYENGISMGGIAIKGSLVSFALENNSPQFNSVIKNCFNLLLPTQGNRLYDIVSGSFSNQTLTMDGRTVSITQYAEGVVVNISE